MQTQKQSAIEAVTNVAFGYQDYFLSQLVIYSLISLNMFLARNYVFVGIWPKGLHRSAYSAGLKFNNNYTSG